MKGRYLSIAAAGLLTVMAARGVQAGNEGKGSDAKAEGQSVARKPIAVGVEAPDFTLKGADGKEVKLSSLRGKYVVLEWVNFDCPFVVAHYNSGNIPGLQKAYTDKGVMWLSICSSANGKQGYFEGETLRGRMEQRNWKGSSYLIDAEGTVGKMYEAKTTPHMFVINPEGLIVYAGAIDSEPTTDVAVIPKSTNYVAAALEATMTGKEPSTAISQPYGCGVKYKQ